MWTNVSRACLTEIDAVSLTGVASNTVTRSVVQVIRGWTVPRQPLSSVRPSPCVITCAGGPDMRERVSLEGGGQLLGLQRHCQRPRDQGLRPRACKGQLQDARGDPTDVNAALKLFKAPEVAKEPIGMIIELQLYTDYFLEARKICHIWCVSCTRVCPTLAMATCLEHNLSVRVHRLVLA